MTRANTHVNRSGVLRMLLRKCSCICLELLLECVLPKGNCQPKSLQEKAFGERVNFGNEGSINLTQLGLLSSQPPLASNHQGIHRTLEISKQLHTVHLQGPVYAVVIITVIGTTSQQSIVKSCCHTAWELCYRLVKCRALFYAFWSSCPSDPLGWNRSENWQV